MRVLVADGQRSEERALKLPLDGPWLGGLSAEDEWNRKLFLGETPGRFLLLSWFTNA